MGKKSRKHNLEVIPETRAVVSLPGTTPYGGMTGAIYPTAYALTIVEAAGIAAVRRCVSLIANAIAGREWQEWEGDTQLNPPSRIVLRPAALMSRREWVWRCIVEMALNDISHLWMIGGVDDEGVPGSLVPIPRQAIHPSGFVDPWGIFPPTQYEISGVPGSISGEAIIPMRSAFWPGVPPHLVGVLQMARTTMMASWASDTYASRYWQAGGAPHTVLTTEQEINGTQADAIADLWVAKRSRGSERPAVLGKGAKAEEYGANVSNAVAVEARREMVLDIGRLFGVSEKYLFVALAGSSQTYANINDESLALDRFTLAGFYEPIQDVISGLLPGDPALGRRMVIDMDPITRAGQEARYRAWAIATGGKPFILPSEVRKAEGLTPNETFDDAPDTGHALAEPEPEMKTKVSNPEPMMSEPMKVEA